MSPAEDARQRLAAGKLTLQEARAIIEEHLRVGLAKGSDEEKRRIAGLVKTWRHQSSLGARGNAVDRNSLDDQTIRSSTWLDWLWTPDSGSSSGSSSRRRSTSASGKQQGDPSDGSGRGSSGRNSQGSEGSSSDADASDDSRLSDRLSGARLSERASDLDPRVGIALVRYSDAIMAFNDAQATMSQGIAGDKKARIAMEERLSRAVALETAATTAAVADVLEAVVARVLNAGTGTENGAEGGETTTEELATTISQGEDISTSPLPESSNASPASSSKNSENDVPSTPPSTPAKGADDTSWYPGKHLGRLLRHFNGEPCEENSLVISTVNSPPNRSDTSSGIVDSGGSSSSGNRSGSSGSGNGSNEVGSTEESNVADLEASFAAWNEVAASRATAWAIQVKQLKEEVDRSFEALESLSSELHSSSSSSSCNGDAIAAPLNEGECPEA